MHSQENCHQGQLKLPFGTTQANIIRYFSLISKNLNRMDYNLSYMFPNFLQLLLHFLNLLTFIQFLQINNKYTQTTPISHEPSPPPKFWGFGGNWNRRRERGWDG